MSVNSILGSGARSRALRPSRRSLTAAQVKRLTAAPFLAIAFVCAAFAFVGLNASDYYVDELFSLFVTDHAGGFAEVFRRALTDTHPPAYYFILHQWIAVFGSSEAATRMLSALCMTAVLPVLFAGLRGTFSLPARSFAVALAAGSRLFFEQAQNTRSYALCALVSAILLIVALRMRRRFVQGEPAPPALMAALTGVGLLGAFLHFYAFLMVGMLHLFLLLSARNVRDRTLIVLSGLGILGLVGAYVASLLGHTQQNLQHMWFSNAPDMLAWQALGGIWLSWTWMGLAAVILLALRLGSRRPSLDVRRAPQPFAPLGLCLLAILGTAAVGLAVSFLLAPSFGKRNLIVLGPFFWAIGAWLYDANRPDPRAAGGLALIVALALATGANALAVRSRFLPRNEEWRGSAAYVDGLPACAGATIPVVLPTEFGPSTPFFRDLARRQMFGRYEISPRRLAIYTPAEFSPAGADPALRRLLRDRGASTACPVMAWGVHDLDNTKAEALRRAIAAAAGLRPSQVSVRRFSYYRIRALGGGKRKVGAFVFERAEEGGPLF